MNVSGTGTASRPTNSSHSDGVLREFSATEREDASNSNAQPTMATINDRDEESPVVLKTEMVSSGSTGSLSAMGGDTNTKGGNAEEGGDGNDLYLKKKIMKLKALMEEEGIESSKFFNKVGLKD